MDEEEAKLLAELKAISSGTDRFQSDVPIPDNSVRTTLVDRHSPVIKQRSKASKEEPVAPPAVLPWKKKKETEKNSQPKSRIQSDTPSAFNGDRGGAAEDPELLALLRGVSNKSGNSRFDDEETDGVVGHGSAREVQSPAPTSEQPLNEKPLPPWKTKRPTSHVENGSQSSDTLTKNPPDGTLENTKPEYGIKSEITSTFNGERGGAAEDAELLALLRGVSEKAGVSRFDDGSKTEPAVTKDTEPTQHDTKVPDSRNQQQQRPLPPWKQKKKVTQPSAVADTDSRAMEKEPSSTKQIKSTFMGERGGSAEDAELLALLRGVSEKAGASRFDDEDNQFSGSQDASTLVSEAKPPPSPPKSEKERPLPPWKRNKAERKGSSLQQANVEGTQSRIVSSDSTEKPQETEPTQQPQYGMKANNHSTYKGERGGTAEDAELLALLRGVSAKSGASRFDDETTSQSDGGGTIPDTELQPAPPKSEKERPLPPWKRKTKVSKESEPKVMVAVAGGDLHLAKEPEPNPQPQYGIKSDVPSTFKGERGGTAEDAELLALLRGVSAKSGTSRFAEEGNDEPQSAESIPMEPPREASPPKSEKQRPLPPWKRKNSAKKQSDVVVVVDSSESAGASEPNPQPQYGIKSDVPSTFKGERGGTAEDAELLALLRGVSAKSGTSRFAEEGNEESQNAKSSPLEPPRELSTSPPKAEKQRPIPPWKRKPKAAEHSEPQVVVTDDATEPAIPQPRYGIKSEAPSTFKGERGGTAEDAELLALLRGVSAKSGTSRFDQGHSEANEGEASFDNEYSTASLKPTKQRPLPPWKRSKSKTELDPGKSQAQLVESLPPNDIQKTGLKSQIQSTFKGERGGTAEDAELLALLRGVSQKSAASRFDDTELPENDPITSSPSDGEIHPSSKSRPQRPMPPWKRKKAVKEAEVVEASSTPQPQYGIKSDIPSTFSGERGGAAEDAELLALLRGVSAKSTSRFNEPKSNETASQPSAGKREDDMTPYSPPVTRSYAASQSDAPQVEVLVSIETLPEAIGDKNWKVRSQAYELLEKILRRQASAQPGLIEADAILSGLEEKVVFFATDVSAPALDKALSFLNLYADKCKSAGSADHAAKIVSSVLKKNALSSRPATHRSACALVLKLMEVGSDGASSVHSIVEVLFSEGLASKKPKVLQSASSLVLEAAAHFGAVALPLATIVSGIPKILSNSNEKVRKTGLMIVAELCRVLGSKSPLQSLFDRMKPAQINEIDSMLRSQSEATPIKTGLRNDKRSTNSSAKEAFAVLQAGSEVMEAQKFAARPAVDLVQAIKKTDYANLLTMPKWSNKVAALDIVISCGGEKPYKLMQPSNSVGYNALVGDMKGLLGHTHFAVVSKALQVLGMLASGVGEKLFPHLRPLLGRLFRLSKDKKLTNAVNGCLDSLYGNVLSLDHVVEGDDALPDAIDEKKEKNVLARKTAIEFLSRCIERNSSSGPRGSLSVNSATLAANLASNKLGDSDASVRKAAMTVLSSLSVFDDRKIAVKVETIIESLKSSNPRAYKNLTKGADSTTTNQSGSPKKNQTPREAIQATAASVPTTRREMEPPPRATQQRISESNSRISSNGESTTDPASCPSIPHLEDALHHVASLTIPKWGDSEDDEGLFEGLKSSKWLCRQRSINSLSEFIASPEIGELSSSPSQSCVYIFVIVKEQTKDFKETNINVMKAILNMCLSVCQCCKNSKQTVPDWVRSDCTNLATQKIADKKLVGLCKELLLLLCVVSPPSLVVEQSFKKMMAVKSPVAHEEFLKWFLSFCSDFGVSIIGSVLGVIIPHLIQECQSTNVKVKRAAFACFGELHRRAGPPLKALSLSVVKHDSLKETLSRTFDDNPYDSSLRSAEPRMSSLCAVPEKGASEGMEVPKSDLFASLPDGIVNKLASKDGKTAWKLRKEAMEEIDSALKASNGALQTGSQQTKQYVDLLRGLRDRLADTQINLRPTAARLIGSLLSSVDNVSQAKFGKIVHAALLNSAMNDIKKPMRDASLETIRLSVMSSDLEGGGLNEAAVESFVSTFSTEVTESSVRAGGLPDVLLLLSSFADKLPNLENTVSTRGQKLSEKYASSVVICLSSSKSDTRKLATSLVEVAIKSGTVDVESFMKATGRLKPAIQRTIGPIIAKYAQTTSSSLAGKENLPADKVPSLEGTGTGTSTKASNTEETTDKRVDFETSEVGEQTQSAPSRKGSASSEKASLHPFAPTKHSAAVVSSISRPAFPDEPSNSFLSTLKKSWSQSLPAATAVALFPVTGIRKQDDARVGCEVLAKGFTMDRSNGECLVLNNLEDIMTWLTCALCSKETATGLQRILDVVRDLLFYLVEQRRGFSDSEAICFFPFLIEKASSAKGRFYDEFKSILSSLEKDSLLTPKQFGALVCVTVFESSTPIRARVLACELCKRCVEEAGLSAIGKRGVLAAANLVSNEPVRHRGAALDLLVTIISKMNGDIQKLFRICGASLSDKARELLEERWTSDRENSSATQSDTAQQRTGSPRKKTQTEPQLYSELPRLSLRAESKVQAANTTRRKNEVSAMSSDDPFTFAFERQKPTEPELERIAPDMQKEPFATTIPQKYDVTAGAAATLRARLQKIREKGKIGDSDASIDCERQSEPLDSIRQTFDLEEKTQQIWKALQLPLPVSESDPELVSCVDVVKLFHACLSQQQYSGSPFSLQEILDLRLLLMENVNTIVDVVRRLMGFSFRSGIPDSNGGIMVRLLSLCVATLMALFKDNEFASRVSTPELTILIQEAGTALLDDKLSSTDVLSEETGTQLVRAINKLAVQASTRSQRHVSFTALLALQKQLSQETHEQPEFNARLGRVTTKLFARVIQAEEAADEPFDTSTIDFKVLISSMEDTIAGCEPAEPCYSMVQTLLAAILQDHLSPYQLRDYMANLDIDPRSSSLGRMMTEWEGSTEGTLQVDVNATSSHLSQPKTPSKDVAALVSRLGNAPEGEERTAALDAIKRFKQVNGDDDLRAHLQQLSGPFREFIEEQLGKTSPSKSAAESGSVSERIRSLRTRLQANEGTQATSSSKVQLSSSSTSDSSPPKFGTKIPSPLKSTGTGIPKSSPSKLQQPLSRTAQSLKDRLAARKTTTSSTTDTSSAGARAAALRARLEAVKQQASQK